MKWTQEALTDLVAELGWDVINDDLHIEVGGTSVYEIEGAGTKWAPIKGTRKYNKDAFIVIKTVLVIPLSHRKHLRMKTRFILFTKDSCGPCGLVKRYFNALKDERTKLIEEVQLEDVSDVPIPEENLALAKKYDVTATPVLIIADEEGELLETYIGGVPITQNIRKLFAKYDV